MRCADLRRRAECAQRTQGYSRGAQGVHSHVRRRAECAERWAVDCANELVDGRMGGRSHVTTHSQELAADSEAVLEDVDVQLMISGGFAYFNGNGDLLAINGMVRCHGASHPCSGATDATCSRQDATERIVQHATDNMQQSTVRQTTCDRQQASRMHHAAHSAARTLSPTTSR